MKVRTKEDVAELMRGSIASAALGTALELGLFWQLDGQPSTVESVSESLDIPAHRCRAWLDLLAGYGLLARQGGVYELTPAGRTAITDTFSQESWALLAQEARFAYPAGDELVQTITQPRSAWDVLGRERRNPYAHMSEDPDYARRFTHMLYEYHQPLAEEIAEALDLTGVQWLMDLGGGSGVVSMAILRRHSEVRSVVVDVATVCDAGRAITSSTSVSDRLTYHPANFLEEELPDGFDMVLECDVGIHSETLFRSLRASLNEGGRLVVVDDLVQGGRPPPLGWLRGAFLKSLEDPEARIKTADRVKEYLAAAGYRLLRERTLQNEELLLEARV